MPIILVKFLPNGKRATVSTLDECEKLVKQGKAKCLQKGLYEEIRPEVSYKTKVMEPKKHPNVKPRSKSRKPTKVQDNENAGNGRGEGHGQGQNNGGQQSGQGDNGQNSEPET